MNGRFDEMNKKLLIAGSMALLLQACATPHVVETRKVTDEQLTCTELTNEIAEAERFEKEARAERKVTGKNVAAAVLFWPALVGTYANTEEAIDAAEERKRHLMDIYSRKGCRR